MCIEWKGGEEEEKIQNTLSLTQFSLYCKGFQEVELSINKKKSGNWSTIKQKLIDVSFTRYVTPWYRLTFWN